MTAEVLITAGFGFLGGVVVSGLTTYLMWGRRVLTKDDHEVLCGLRQELVKKDFNALKAGLEELKTQVNWVVTFLKNGKAKDG